MCLLLVVGAVLSASAGENWPQWRGPTLDGVSPCRNVPVEWGEGRHVVWKVALPSWSGATPIVWGARVFIVSPSSGKAGGEGEVARSMRRMGGRESPGGKEILLLCFATADGKLLWQRTLDDRNALYGKQNMSSPSPVTDGRHVWVMTGTGVLTALDMSGEVKWRVDLRKEFGDFELLWGYASSPLLLDDMLIVEVLHSRHQFSPSYVVAFDAATGKVRWRQERKTDATRECPDAYTTPALWRGEGRLDLVISGADYITGHDPKDGRELWRAGGLNPEKQGNYRIVASPVVVGGLVVAPTRVKPLLAVRGGGQGDVSESHIAWKLERGGPDVPTPVSDGKRLYVVDDKGIVTCVDMATGQVVWGPSRTAVGTVSASPLLADGRVYVTNELAVTTVLEAGSEFKVIATNVLDDGYTISSLAVADSRVYVRTSASLYCISRPGP
jgi:outer membrane protein assembly factor BamB